MATRLTDIVEPAQFTDYVLEKSVEKTALVQSGAVTRNSVIQTQLSAGAHSFTAPYWKDLDGAPDIISDDPSSLSTPNDVIAGKQVVRKSFLHNSWSAMNLASEIAGDNAIGAIQGRVADYWSRVMQKRLVASLEGVMAANVADNSSDMVEDISDESGEDANFSAAAVIDTAGTLGDALSDLSAIAMHSDVYVAALKNDLIDFIPDSQGTLTIPTFRGLAVIVDDGLPTDASTYTTVLLGSAAVGYGMTSPRIADGTEIENIPAAGDGGGQEVLHSRVNTGLHPVGFSWNEASVSGESPTTGELATADNWSRTADRKAVPIAFLKSKIG